MSMYRQREREKEEESHHEQRPLNEIKEQRSLINRRTREKETERDDSVSHIFLIRQRVHSCERKVTSELEIFSFSFLF